MQPATDQNPPVPATPPPKRGSSALGCVVAIPIFAIIGFLAWQNIAASKVSREKSEASASPAVRTVIVQHPSPKPAESELLLPADVQAFRQTTLYAQTPGYLKRWLVDLGDGVKEGQLLAEIDTPQLDQQFAQARAALEQAQANLGIAQTTAARWQDLLKTHAVAAQDADEKLSAAKAQIANVAAAQANVDALAALEAFKKIVAPFEGTITSRSVEMGSLVSVGSSPTELFKIAQTDRLRVLVNVPQAYMRSVEVSMKADLLAREYGPRVFPGAVTRTAKAIDLASRTLLTEVEMPNADGALLPGMYAQIRFHITDKLGGVLIPSSALIVRSAGPMAAVVDAQKRYAYRKISLGLDLGSQIEVTEGLKTDDLVVTAPSDDLTEGAILEVQMAVKK